MSEARGRVVAVIERETGQAVTEETRLDELGLDSLEFLDLLLAVANETDREVIQRSPAFETVGDLVRAAVGE